MLHDPITQIIDLSATASDRRQQPYATIYGGKSYGDPYRRAAGSANQDKWKYLVKPGETNNQSNVG